MKKSKIIKLVLITGALASCAKKEDKEWEYSVNKYHVRTDTTAAYTTIHNSHRFYAFRPYGYFLYGRYHPTGYWSSGIHEKSNIGRSTTKSAIARGGFGRATTVSS
jgi:hypothetical protein